MNSRDRVIHNKKTSRLWVIGFTVLGLTLVVFVALIKLGDCWFSFESNGQVNRLRSLTGEIIVADTSRMQFRGNLQDKLIGRLESVEYVFNDVPCFLSVQIYMNDIKSEMIVGGQKIVGKHRVSITLTPNDMQYITKLDVDPVESE